MGFLLLLALVVMLLTSALGVVSPIAISSPLRIPQKKAYLSVSRGGASESSSGFSPGSLLAIVRESKNHLVAAGLARGISILTFFPVDTIKTQLQTTSSTIGDILTRTSLGGYFSGVGPAMIGQIPYGVLTFGR